MGTIVAAVGANSIQSSSIRHTLTEGYVSTIGVDFLRTVL